jgi:uncharacterized protein (DUF2252 family)
MTAVGRPPSLALRLEAGRQERSVHPRSALAELDSTNRDPLGILHRQNATRVPELIPLRRQRMSVSPFTFYRGTAAIMAADLARSPDSGISVAACGDAHVSNFGFYASPERTLVFDLNDFDEAAWAPWEWDVKRLVTSVVVAGQSTKRDDAVIRRAARDTVFAYNRAVHTAVSLSPTSRYFTHFSASRTISTFDRRSRTALRAAIESAERRTGERAAKRLTEADPDGVTRRFVEDPPTMTRIPTDRETLLRSLFEQYVTSANVDIRVLLQQFSITDLARRVVGVGSVGTRCSLVLLQDGDAHTLLLQAKEANQSVLIEYGKTRQPPEATAFIERFGQGGRVVGMQRILQGISDPFMGHVTSEGIDFYVRQFHDMKGSVEIESLDDDAYSTYSEACAIVLARAHMQSPNAASIAGYLGNGRRAADAIVEWAYAYADLSRGDYKQFLEEQQD